MTYRKRNRTLPVGYNFLPSRFEKCDTKVLGMGQATLSFDGRLSVEGRIGPVVAYIDRNIRVTKVNDAVCKIG